MAERGKAVLLSLKDHEGAANWWLRAPGPHLETLGWKK